MQRIEVRQSHRLAAATVLAGIVFAWAGIQGPGAPSEAAAMGTAGRSSQATAVEAQVARTDLAGTMELALGDEFAGIWFEPATAHVGVGFTSTDARRTIDAVAARAGLAGRVIPTPVRSTWAQLGAAQDRWGGRLEDLFERAEVATALSAERNAVTIELGSLVPSSRRAALQRRAADAGVNVFVSVAAEPELRVVPEARCAAFAATEAACEKPIVAGVSIMGSQVKKSEIEEGEAGEEDTADLEFVEEGEELGRGRCTAGPAVIEEKPADKTAATKTYILTAGHCIDSKRGGGGIGAKWAAYNKKVPPEEKELGPAVTFLNAKTDVGVIEVTTAYWAEAKNPIPVTPALAIWGAAESEPLPVIAQNTPMENTTSCVSGQISQTNCGEIVTVDQKITVRKVTTENLIEVKGATTAKGDSGAPWFSESQYKKGFGYIEGTHVGRKGATGNPVFQSLATSFAELKSLKSLSLKLLTTANERRHPAVTASAYPATVSAKEAGEGRFTAFGSSVKCSGTEFDGTLVEPSPEAEANTFELTPTYTGCTALTGVPATVKNNECKYKFTLLERIGEGKYKASVDIVCPAGKAGIEIHVYANGAAHESGTDLCKLTVPPQTGLKSVTLTNSSGKIVLDSGKLEGVKVKIHRFNKILCPGTETESETSTGAYDIEKEVTLSGTKEGKAVEMDMAGG
jgi:hypothetical protein